MARIMIKCPSTGKAILTGMAADESSFASSGYATNEVFCPECKQSHIWSKKDAFLEGQAGQ